MSVAAPSPRRQWLRSPVVVLAPPVSGVDWRWSWRVAIPEPPSVPVVKVTATERPAWNPAGYETVPAPGAVESLANVKVVGVALFATSRPVTASVGPLVVPPAQLNTLETYGPSEGVDTVEGVWVQPVVVPPRAAVALDAGPEPASVTAFVRVNEPTATPR